MATFRAMTWNVQNLLPVGFQGGPQDQAEFDAKIESLAAVIDAAQPDVVGLQEVGPPAVIQVLQDALAHALPERAVSDLPDGRGIRVAFLSRVPITDVVQITELPAHLAPVQIADLDPQNAGAAFMTSLKRGALEITVEVDGGPVTLLVAHLKSKLLSYPGGRFAPRDEDERARVAGYALNRRTVEAVALRAQLNTVLSGGGRERAVVLLGDLNDEVEAATTQILNGPGGSELRTAGFARSDNGDGDRMWNLAPLIPGEQRFSRVYRGRRELIDHIFCSRRMLDAEPTLTTLAAAASEQAAIIASDADVLPSVTDDPRLGQGKAGSDHSVVVASFDLG